jgi:opacity protein-like surface antigen
MLPRHWQKGLAASMLAVLIATPAWSQNLLHGTKEIGLSGGIDFDTAEDSEFNLGLTYGYYIMDQVEVGGYVSIRDNDAIQQLEASAFAQYDFDLRTPWVPYIQARAGWARGETNYVDSMGMLTDETNDAVIGTLRPGIRYHLNDFVALDLNADFQYASEKIFDEQDEINDTQVLLNWGIRAYW